jgi:peptide/nickel transport system ATP-binding protein
MTDAGNRMTSAGKKAAASRQRTAAPAQREACERPVLEVSDLCVSYGAAPVVEGASLSVARGASLGVVGESGAGKSTLLHAIARLLPGNAQVTGSIRVGGRDLATCGEDRLASMRGRAIGFVFQNPGRMLDSSMRCGDQVAELVRMRDRCSRRQAREQARDLLGRMRFDDVEHVARAYPFELSGGMQQRVSIALALAFDPPLLLCDEPTSALDAVAQLDVARELARVQRDRGCAMVLVTHDIALAYHLCDRIAVMDGGRIVEEGAAEDVVRAPKSSRAAALVSAARELGR